MSAGKNPETVYLENDDEFLEELSDYLDVLSNPTRLKILKAIENVPKDIREISYEVGVSYENTKKHIQKLNTAGVIRKETGISSRSSKGIHPVWKYSLMPGGLDSVFSNLQIFSCFSLTPGTEHISERVNSLKEEILAGIRPDNPAVIIIGGPEDARIWPVEETRTRIGRADNDSTYAAEKGDVIISEFHSAVSRISKPHCRIIRENDRWFIEDIKSTGGTYINGEEAEKGIRTEIFDGSTIELSRSTKGAKMIFCAGKKMR
jgi:DNA-binding transcriptional ArsR family regulator